MYRWGYDFAKIWLTRFIPQFLYIEGSLLAIRRDQETQAPRRTSYSAGHRQAFRYPLFTHDCCSHDLGKRGLQFRLACCAVGYGNKIEL